MSTAEELYEELKGRSKAGGDRQLIWHYTTWESFEKIVDTNTLWATQLGYLNDKSELRHAFELSKDVFAGTYGYWHGRINEALKDDQQDLGGQFYVASLSQSFDSLTQWQQYSKGSIGVAVGFSRDQLQAIADRYGFETKPCIYEDSQKRAVLETLRAARAEHLAHVRAKLEDPSFTGNRSMTELGIGRSDIGSWRDFIATAITFKDESSLLRMKCGCS